MSQTNEDAPSERVLDPYDRLSEILFGLIMVLTFTCSVSVSDLAPGDIKVMLIGALGCNVAWGIIDGFLYLMACMADKGRGLKIYRAVRATSDPKVAQELIAGEMPPLLASVMQPAEFASLHHRLKQLPEPPKIIRLTKSEWLGFLGVFLLVFLSTFPPVLPFIFMKDVGAALALVQCDCHWPAVPDRLAIWKNFRARSLQSGRRHGAARHRSRGHDDGVGWLRTE